MDDEPMSTPDSHEDRPPTEPETGSSESGKSGQKVSFKSKAIRGSAVSLAQTGVSRVISLGCQILFARMLMPSDFGLVGIAIATMSLLTFASPLALEFSDAKKYRVCYASIHLSANKRGGVSWISRLFCFTTSAKASVALVARGEAAATGAWRCWGSLLRVLN